METKLFKTVLVMSIILAGFISCQETPTPVEIDFSIFRDITGSTENTNIDITPKDVLEMFGVDNNPQAYGKFRTSVLSDVHLAKVEQVRLKPVKTLNKYIRQAAIEKFKLGIDSLLTNLKQVKSEKEASSLFIPISKELRRLSRSTAQHKYLVIYSDLFEHSNSLFSVYSDEEFKQIVENPEKLIEFFEKYAKIPDDLYGIKVFVIFNPQLADDTHFLAISNIYKELLESKEAEVFIGANLILD